jgi:hypothetical protein
MGRTWHLNINKAAGDSLLDAGRIMVESGATRGLVWRDCLISAPASYYEIS